MEALVYFFTAFGLSALGSIPPGLITLTIMQRTIHAGRKAGLMVALGASIPEFVYAYVAMISLRFFQENIAIEQGIQGFATVVFLALGSYYLLKESKPPQLEVSPQKNRRNFIQGLWSGVVNMLIIPFWIFIGSWLSTYDFVFSDSFLVVVFSLGAALGAFVVFLMYAELGNFLLRRLGDIVRYTNKAVGLIFLGLGFYQLIQWWYSMG